MYHASHPTDDYPEVVEAFGLREWTNKVHSYRVPRFLRDWEGMQLPFERLIRSLGSLAGLTRPAEHPGILHDSRPPIPTADVVGHFLFAEMPKGFVCLGHNFMNKVTIPWYTQNFFINEVLRLYQPFSLREKLVICRLFKDCRVLWNGTSFLYNQNLKRE